MLKIASPTTGRILLCFSLSSQLGMIRHVYLVTFHSASLNLVVL